MSPPFPCRYAWISTGVNLRAASSQRPQWIGNGRNSLRQRDLSVSAIKNEEEREAGSPIPGSDEGASEQKVEHTSTAEDTSVSDTARPVAGKAKAPQSLKDIFPDLFGNTKPLIARSGPRGSRKDWEWSLEESMYDPAAIVDVRRPSRPSPRSIGSTLSSILNTSSDAEKGTSRPAVSTNGTKDRTRAPPKELKAFHELLESMFEEASEAQAAESGNAKRNMGRDSGARRGDQSFGMDRFSGPHDSYLSDTTTGRRHSDRREPGTFSDVREDRSRIIAIAKPVGSMRNVTDAEMEDYMQKREVIASMRTDLDILEWLNRTYFDSNAATSGKAETTDIDASSTSTFSASYPLVLAYTISVLHLRFHNPHAALAVFDIARSFTLESYLVGCTTAVYNEMLRARWEGLGDLKGVEEGLEEMGRRGVGWDKETMRFATALVEKLVKLRLAPFSRENASTSPTSVSNDQRLVWAYGSDVFERLARLEEMVENQVEFSERGVRIQMKRRADELREQEEGEMRTDGRFGQNPEGREFGGRSAMRY